MAATSGQNRRWILAIQDAKDQGDDLDEAQEDDEQEQVDQVGDDHRRDVVGQLLDEGSQHVHEGAAGKLVATQRPATDQIAPPRPPG